MPAKRELVEPKKGDKRYGRRDAGGKFGETDDVSRSSARDQKKKAKSTAKRGQGDKGDRKASSKSASKSTRKSASKSTRKSATKSTRKTARKSARKAGGSKTGRGR